MKKGPEANHRPAEWKQTTLAGRSFPLKTPEVTWAHEEEEEWSEDEELEDDEEEEWNEEDDDDDEDNQIK